MPLRATLEDPTPDQALRQARIIWGALLAGQAGFLAVVAFLLDRGGLPGVPAEVGRVLLYVSLALLATLVPIGYAVRRVIFSQQRAGAAVSPAGYVRGTIVLLAMCEAVALFAIVAVLLRGSFFPAILPAVLALLVQIRAFPQGHEMRPEAGPEAPVEPR